MAEISFGENLKNLRKKYGFTREQLAQRISYSVKSIEKWELNGILPPVHTVCKLADFFNVTTDYLLFGSNVEAKYLLGIDGGGTKTEFLLTDLNRKEIRRVLLGTSNPVDIGIEACKKVLEDGITQVCSGIRLRDVSVFAGLAGGITGTNKEAIHDFLSGFNFAKCRNGSDIENALEMAFAGACGTVIIMGTGIIAYTQTPGGCERIGGWGYLIDKGGSGYNFGSDALESALKYIDGRGGSERINRLLEQELEMPVPQAIAQIYQRGKAYIASLAHTVFAAYQEGDPYAAEIIARNMKEVACLIEASLKKSTQTQVVICGGLCRYSDILKRFLPKYDCDIRFITRPMVEGAVALAAKN